MRKEVPDCVMRITYHDAAFVAFLLQGRLFLLGSTAVQCVGGASLTVHRLQPRLLAPGVLCACRAVTALWALWHQRVTMPAAAISGSLFSSPGLLSSQPRRPSDLM